MNWVDQLGIGTSGELLCIW